MPGPENRAGELSHLKYPFAGEYYDVHTELSQTYTQTQPRDHARNDALRYATTKINMSTLGGFYRPSNDPEEIAIEKAETMKWYQAITMASKNDWTPMKEMITDKARRGFGSAAEITDIGDPSFAEFVEKESEWLINLARSI